MLPAKHHFIDREKSTTTMGDQRVEYDYSTNHRKDFLAIYCRSRLNMQNRHRRATIFQKFSIHQSKLLEDVRKKSVALIKGQGFKENIMDEIYLDSIRQKPVSLEELCKKTKFSKRELKILYRGFKQECPSGTINEEKFSDILCQFYPHGDASLYAFLIFPTFDKNRCGFLTFEDLLMALSKITRGSIEERLGWMFSVYDRNADGYITFNEILEVDKAVHAMVGKHSQPTEPGLTVASHAAEAFERLDLDKDGQISETDFYQAMYSNEFLFDSLKQLDTIL